MSLTRLLFATEYRAGVVAALVHHPVYGLVTYIGLFDRYPLSRWRKLGVLHDLHWSVNLA